MLKVVYGLTVKTRAPSSYGTDLTSLTPTITITGANVITNKQVNKEHIIKRSTYIAHLFIL
jgi:hypothetical protein